MTSEASIEVPIADITAAAFTIPTDHPEADGTIAWNSTTLVLVQATAGDVRGIGYSYADVATAQFVTERLARIAEHPVRDGE